MLSVARIQRLRQLIEAFIPKALRSYAADDVTHLPPESPLLDQLHPEDSNLIRLAFTLKKQASNFAYLLWKQPSRLTAQRLEGALTQYARVLHNIAAGLDASHPPLQQLVEDTDTSLLTVQGVLAAEAYPQVESRMDALAYNSHALISWYVYARLGLSLRGRLMEGYPRVHNPANADVYKGVTSRCPWGWRRDRKTKKCEYVGLKPKGVLRQVNRIKAGGSPLKDKPPAGVAPRRSSSLSTPPGTRLV